MRSSTTLHGLSEIDPPRERYIYRYTGSDGLTATLLRQELRLSPWMRMNDPRERKEWRAADVVGAGKGLRAAPPLTDYDLQAEVDRILRRGARLACFTLDDSPRPGSAPGHLFHRGWARSAMWDRYAAAHSGACIVFDQADLFGQVRDWAELNVRSGNITTQGYVEYRDVPVIVHIDGTYTTLDQLRERLDDSSAKAPFITDLYLTKCTDWAAEREYRIVQVLWDLPDAELDDPMYVPIGGALKAVILGEVYRDVATLKRDLFRVSRGNPPDLFRCAWRDGAPGLEMV
jgi:hypothetical protein